MPAHLWLLLADLWLLFPLELLLAPSLAGLGLLSLLGTLSPDFAAGLLALAALGHLLGLFFLAGLLPGLLWLHASLGLLRVLSLCQPDLRSKLSFALLALLVVLLGLLLELPLLSSLLALLLLASLLDALLLALPFLAQILLALALLILFGLVWILLVHGFVCGCCQLCIGSRSG